MRILYDPSTQEWTAD
jgi:hypothetical protein